MPVEKYLNHEPQFMGECFIASTASVVGKVKLGKNTSIWHNAVLRGDVNNITMGDYSNVQDCSAVHVDNNLPTVIGNYVTIGHGAIIHGCTIEDNCLIGMGAIILDGAVIGKGSIIGAGSLVPPGKVIPSNSLVMGLPAKVVKEIEQERADSNIRHAEHYWQLAGDYLVK